jgi:MFS family permease
MTRCLRNRMYPMLVAICVITVTSIPLIFLPDTVPGKYFVYPLVAIQGVGLAIMLNTATSLISDVIGQDAENSAFVYGVYSLFDKFANGFLLYYIVATYPDDAKALKYIMAITPVICAAGACILTCVG